MTTKISPQPQAVPTAPQWTTLFWQNSLLFVMSRAAVGVQKMPLSSALRFGSLLGRLGYRMAKSPRRRALTNLKLAYGENMSPHDGERLTQRIFEHFGRGAIEFLRAPALTMKELDHRVTTTGWEHIEAARAAGKGGVLVTAHFGNWEVMGHWLARTKRLPLTVVARDPENPAFASYVRDMRETSGATMLSKGTSARGMLRALQENEFVMILADQNSGDLFAPFFGVPAGTVAGPASLALHSGRPLIPVFGVADPGGRLKVSCFPPIEAPAHRDRKAAVQHMMEEYNQVLETVVREHPEQWLWLHNRWKSAFEEHNRERAWGTATPALG